MGNYTLVVYTSPVEGREDDYNEWYDNQHLGDVIAAAGFDRAERLRLTDIGKACVFVVLEKGAHLPVRSSGRSPPALI